MYENVSTIVTVVFFIVAGFTIFNGIKKRNK